MATQLIEFTVDRSSEGNPDPAYSAQLIETNAELVKANFKSTPIFCPILVLGQSCQQILIALFKHACPELEDPEQSFEDEAFDGVLVWPQPIQIEGVTLMVLCLKEPADEGLTKYMALRERVLMGLAMLSSVCGLCEEKKSFMNCSKKFVESYRSISEHVGLEISKFEVFTEDSWLKTAAGLGSLKNSVRPLFETARRNNDTWVLPLVKSLNQSTDPFLKSHEHLFEGGYISAFLNSTASFVEKANKDQEFAKFASVVRPCFHPCVKAQCLMKFDSPSAVQLSPQTVDLLKKIFADIPTFCPFLAFGSFGGNDVLTALLKYARPDIANPESCFVECAADGVYVFPEPVQVGEVTLMLLLFRTSVGIDNELRRKITAGLTMFSSICCLCEGRDQRLDFFEVFQQDYSLISQNLSLKISKLEVLVEDIDEELGEVLNPSLGIILRDRVGQDEHLIPSFFDRFIHDPFIKSHNAKFGEGPYIRGFLHWTESFVQKASMQPGFYRYIFELQTYVPPCTKAQCLIKFGPSSSGSYSARLEPDTCRALEINFSSIRDFYPILVYGSKLKSKQLSALLKYACPDLENVENCFKGFKDDGVYVWLEPLNIGNVTIMLLKMRKPTRNLSGIEGYADLRRKSMVLEMLCSVCCLCEERSQVIDDIDAFVQDYSGFSHKLHLRISKLLVFLEEGWFSKEGESCQLNRGENDNSELVKFIYRGKGESSDDWIQPLVSSLAKPQFHRIFSRSHSHLIGESYIAAFLQWSTVLVKMMNLNLEFGKYVSKLPDTTDPEAASQITAVSEKVAKADKICAQGQALQFVVKQKSTVALDSDVLNIIPSNYKLQDPTVVFVVMGDQGHGKSTFLNHIVQYITESPQLPSVFKTGNTGKHTTKGSQVLSYPLFHKGQQIMLIDLEGLEGTETFDSEAATLQANLVSALLTVASFPCILVHNRAQSLRIVDNYVTQIAKLQVDFGFLTERIYLLFHDKPAGSKNEENKDFTELVEILNCRHFQGREVIKMLNKPNFVAENGGAQRQQFLETLLNGSLFIKKNSSGTHVNIPELLTQMFTIASNESEDLSGLQPSPADLDLKVRYTARIHEDLQQIKQGITSQDNQHLLIYFNETIRTGFTNSIRTELDRMPPGLKRQCQLFIDLELNLIKTELMELEACYTFIRVIETEQMRKNIESLIQYLHKSAWTLIDFLPKVEALEKKLELVRSHFPQSDATITPLLEIITSCKYWKIAKSSLTYVLQVGLIVGSMGAGAFLGTALNTARGGVAVAEGATMFSGAAIGFGVGLGGNLTGGLSAAMAMAQKAMELVWVNSWSGNGQLNPKALLSVSNSGEPATLDPKAPVSVLMLIGSRATKAAEFANFYIRYIAPFTPAEFQAFHPNKYTQVLSFDYIHPDQSDKSVKISTCYLICLRMRKKPTAKYSSAMQKLAVKLFPAATVACLLVDNPTQYAESLLDILCPAPTPGHTLSAEAKMKTKVVLIHRNGVETGGMRRALHRCAVNYEAKPIEQFDQGNIRLMIPNIKWELDQARLRPSEELNAIVNSLPRVLAEFRL